MQKARWRIFVGSVAIPFFPQWQVSASTTFARCCLTWGVSICSWRGATSKSRRGPLLSFAGDVVALPNETAFNAAMVSLCASTWIYNLAHALAAELERHGLEPDVSRALTLGNIAGPASFALGVPERSLLDISAGIATEQTFTKTGLDHLKARHFDDPWKEAIARLAQMLKLPA